MILGDKEAEHLFCRWAAWQLISSCQKAVCLFPNFLFDAWLCLSVDDAKYIFWEASAHKYLKHGQICFKIFYHESIMPAARKCSPVTICCNEDKQLLYVIRTLNWTWEACVFNVKLFRKSTVLLTLSVHQRLEGVTAKKYQQHYFAGILLACERSLSQTTKSHHIHLGSNSTSLQEWLTPARTG